MTTMNEIFEKITARRAEEARLSAKAAAETEAQIEAVAEELLDNLNSLAKAALELRDLLAAIEQPLHHARSLFQSNADLELDQISSLNEMVRAIIEELDEGFDEEDEIGETFAAEECDCCDHIRAAESVFGSGPQPAVISISSEDPEEATAKFLAMVMAKVAAENASGVGFQR